MRHEPLKKQVEGATYTRFAIICMGYLFVLVPRFALAVNADKITQDLNLTPAALGVLASSYFYTYALTQAPSGFLADKLAPEILIITSLATVTLSNFLFAFAPSFGVAIISRLITGLTGSLVYVPALRFTASNFPASKFSLFSSFIVAINGLCVIMVNGPLVILSERYGWRSIFVLSGIATAISAFGLAALYRINNGGACRKPEVCVQPKASLGLRGVIENKLAWPMFFRTFVTYGVQTSFQSLWAGPYMMGVLQMTRSATGATLVFMSAASLVANPIGGYLSDSVLKTRRLLVTFAVGVSALCWLPLIILVDTISSSILTLTLCLMSFAGGLGAGAQLAQVKEVYPPEAAGAAMGVNNLFLISGGAILPTAFGLVIGSQIVNPAKQFSNAFLLNFVCMAIAAVTAFCSVETFDKEPDSVAVLGRFNLAMSSQNYNETKDKGVKREGSF